MSLLFTGSKNVGCIIVLRQVCLKGRLESGSMPKSQHSMFRMAKTGTTKQTRLAIVAGCIGLYLRASPSIPCGGLSFRKVAPEMGRMGVVSVRQGGQVD